MTMEVVRDPITDQVSADAILRDAGQRLSVSCDPAHYRGLRVSFSSMHWLARGNVLTGERAIVYRFDDQRPRRLLWQVGSRSGHIGDRRGRVAPFLRALIGAQRLVLRTRDVEERPFDLTFRIVGARPAIARLLEACGESELKDSLFGASAS
jgi:hypothetical protein